MSPTFEARWSLKKVRAPTRHSELALAGHRRERGGIAHRRELRAADGFADRGAGSQPEQGRGEQEQGGGETGTHGHFLQRAA